MRYAEELLIQSNTEVKKMGAERDCLLASLTLLVKANILDESDITMVIDKGAFEGLYDLLNEKYKEIFNV